MWLLSQFFNQLLMNVSFIALPTLRLELDVRAQGFWGIHHQQAYFNVCVFNPLATSNCQSAISTCFRSHDNEKRRVYEQHVRDVE